MTLRLRNNDLKLSTVPMVVMSSVAYCATMVSQWIMDETLSGHQYKNNCRNQKRMFKSDNPLMFRGNFKARWNMHILTCLIDHSDPCWILARPQLETPFHSFQGPCNSFARNPLACVESRVERLSVKLPSVCLLLYAALAKLKFTCSLKWVPAASVFAKRAHPAKL